MAASLRRIPADVARRRAWFAGAVLAAVLAGCDAAPPPGGVVPYEALLVDDDVDEDDLVTEAQLGLRANLVEVPDEVRLEEGLRYVVELRNEGKAAVSLDPCPAYYQAWGESGTGVSRTSYLSCDGAPGEIAPGESMKFEMELPIAEAGAGDGFAGRIIWYLGHPGSADRGEMLVSGEVVTVSDARRDV